MWAAKVYLPLVSRSPLYITFWSGPVIYGIRQIFIDEKLVLNLEAGK